MVKKKQTQLDRIEEKLDEFIETTNKILLSILDAQRPRTVQIEEDEDGDPPPRRKVWVIRSEVRHGKGGPNGVVYYAGDVSESRGERPVWADRSQAVEYTSKKEAGLAKDDLYRPFGDSEQWTNPTLYETYEYQEDDE